MAVAVIELIASSLAELSAPVYPSSRGNMRANGLALVFGLTASGCGAKLDVEVTSDALVSNAGPYVASLADPDGLQWVALGPVRQFSSSPSSTRRTAPREQGEGRTLSLSEFAEKLRPHMLGADNVEYVLDSSQALEFAARVQASTRPDDEIFDDGRRIRAFSPTVFSATGGGTSLAADGVFDGESRQNINAIAANHPFIMIGVLLDRCTVFKMINAHTAITSAHCVFDENGWKTRVPIQFGAGSPTPMPALDEKCYSVMVPGGWTEDVGDDEYDYAVIRLRTNGGAGGANCDLASYDVGHFGFRGVSGCTTDVPGDMSGYPGKAGPGTPPPESWTYPTLFNDFRTDGWTSCITYPNHLWYYNDNSGGQSGGPFFTTSGDAFHVRAINMAISPGVFDDSNAGRRLDNSVIEFMKEFAGF